MNARCSGGNTVAIFGAGPIGLMLAMLGQYNGAGGVIVVEPSTYRRRKAGSRCIARHRSAVGRPGGADTGVHPR